MKQALLLALFVGVAANADTIQPAEKLSFGFLEADLVATKLSFGAYIVDDVNPSVKALRIAIAVKNIGRLAVVPPSGQTAVVLRQQTLYGNVYGPSSRGGRLNDKIFPGETGLISVALPLGGLRHCDRVRVQIDRQRNLQKGGAAVYANDTSNMTATEYGNLRVCVLPPLPLP